MSGTRYGTIAIHDNDDDVDDDKAAAAAAAAVDGGFYQHHHEGAPLLKQPEGGDLQQSSSSSSSSTSKALSSLLIGEYWSHLTFGWITPLLARGNSEGQLSISDLRDWSLPTNCQTEEVYAVFRRCWEEERCRARANNNSNAGGNGVDHEEKRGSSLEENGSSKGEANAKEGDEATLRMDGLFDSTSSSSSYKHRQQQPSLIWTLYKSFGTEFINAGYLKLIHDACLFVGPQVLNRLIHFVRTPEYTLTYGLGLVAAGELMKRKTKKRKTERLCVYMCHLRCAIFKRSHS